MGRIPGADRTDQGTAARNDARGCCPRFAGHHSSRCRGYLNLLLQDPQSFGITDETRQILERCAKSVDQRRQIINQMLELSVLEGEETSLDYSVFSVRGMVNAVIAGGGYALKAEIAIDIPADSSLIEADRQKLSYIIDVLVANGMSYSKPAKKDLDHVTEAHRLTRSTGLQYRTTV